MILSTQFSFPEPKHFYRRVEAIFEALESTGTSESFARGFLSEFRQHLAAALGVSCILLYERHSSGLILLSRTGVDCSDFREELEMEFLSRDKQDLPWITNLRKRIGAVIPAGNEGSMLMVFVADEALSENEAFRSNFSSAFSSLHYALVQNLRRLELQDGLEQVRAIQMSLLPSKSPSFGDFDIAALSVPARIVGGDLYDFQLVDPETLAITVADAAGHGLTAALQARDVLMGLRMGVERNLKITGIVEKLNRVIHQSGLVSRFVSLVFGELFKNGTFAYVNAGHPRPLLMNAPEVEQLESGGMILGPKSDSVYGLSFAEIQPGGALLLFSDGVLEHASPAGKEFGVENLKTWLNDSHRSESAELAVRDLFDVLKDFGGDQPFRDDVTVVFIRRAAPTT
jgi:sigma-B regulation protein RsbU (phosphoserine phosphatase)